MFIAIAPLRRSFSTDAASSSPVLFGEDRSGTHRIHRITLNRPKALNALNMPMVELLIPQYRQWQTATEGIVFLEGSGSKAFCAGGDIRSMYDARQANAVAGQPGSMLYDFFFREYRLNALIGSLPIPHVAYLQGFVMGGGCGVSMHGSHRVATPTAALAMPEVGIGLFCDVGGSWFLPRLTLPGVGLYLALTGHRITGKELVLAGAATHYDARGDREAVVDGLRASGTSWLDAHCTLPTAELHDTELFQYATQIDTCFGSGATTLDAVVERLRADHSPWAAKALASIGAASPTSVCVVFEQLKRGAHQCQSLPHALRMEFGMSQAFMGAHDFFEGVRALLVDKDKSPKWVPASLHQVQDEAVARYFEHIAAVDWHPEPVD